MRRNLRRPQNPQPLTTTQRPVTVDRNDTAIEPFVGKSFHFISSIDSIIIWSRQSMDDKHKSYRQRNKKQKVQKSIVDHTYRDYSEVELSLDDKITAHDGTFPPTLHTIMSNPMYRRIICWQVRFHSVSCVMFCCDCTLVSSFN